MLRRSELGQYLNEAGLLGIGIELGTFRGDFAQELLETWRGRKLILVDKWRHLPDYHDSWNLPDSEMEHNYRFTLTRLARFNERVSILRMRGEEAARVISDESCDLIYIDANHAYEAVKCDLLQWFPKLRPGGLMSGHDYFDALADDKLDPVLGSPTSHLPSRRLTSYGVKRAVDEFVASIGAQLFVTAERLPTWYFTK